MVGLSAVPWAVMLAGGDGTRLRPLTLQIAGDDRPKQFCPLIDGQTLLARTRRRVDLEFRPDHQVVVVTRQHEAYFGELADVFPGRLVVQPSNRGTTAGIVYPLLTIRGLAGNVPVVIFPSDHDVGDDRAFMDYVISALQVVNARPDLVVLLGIEATGPETEYGWIEPMGMPLPLDGEPVFPIKRFWEKPSSALASSLLQRGCLWNSFVMVGWASAFLGLIRATLPAVLLAFEPLRRVLGCASEVSVAQRVYAGLPDRNFSYDVLGGNLEGLSTLRVKGVDWTDLGNPARVIASLERRTGCYRA